MFPTCPLDGTGSVPKPWQDGVSGTHTGVGSPGRCREDGETSAEREESLHGVSALHLAVPTISQQRKHRALNPLKTNSARAQAQKGDRGHCRQPGRVSLLETRAASASGNYLRGLEDVFSLRPMLINRSLESGVLPGRPGALWQHGQRFAESFLPARAPECSAPDAKERLPKGQHREQQKGARKFQNLFKTNLNQGAINQAQK